MPLACVAYVDMPMTHRPEIGAEVDSENRRQNRYRFLKSIFHSESTRDEKSAPKTNMAECNVKITNSPYNLHL